MGVEGSQWTRSEIINPFVLCETISRGQRVNTLHVYTIIVSPLHRALETLRNSPNSLQAHHDIVAHFTAILSQPEHPSPYICCICNHIFGFLTATHGSVLFHATVPAPTKTETLVSEDEVANVCTNEDADDDVAVVVHSE
jgi:hypothetical protein